MTARALLIALLVVIPMSRLEAARWVHRSPAAAYVTDLAAVPGSQTLFAATTGGLFRTDDGGDTWLHVSAMGRSNVRVVLVDAADTRLVYAGGSEGMFRSTDGGRSWSLALTGSVRTASFDPLRSTVWALADGKLYRSLDRGNSWTPVTVKPSPLMHLAVRPDTSTVYVGGVDAVVYASSDAGSTWTTVPRPEALSQPEALFGVDGALLIASGGLFRTTNDGATWTALPALPNLARVSSATLDAAGMLYVGTQEHGVFRRAGDGWEPVGNPTQLSSITALEWHGATLFAGTPGRGTFRTTPPAGWVAPRVAIDTASANVIAFEPLSTTLYAGTTGGLFRSSDRGQSWTLVGFSESDVVALLVHGETLTVATRNDGVYRSSDGAATWQKIEGHVVTLVMMIAANPRDPRRIAAATLNGAYISDDGRTWRRSSSVTHLTGVAFDPIDSQTILISTSTAIWRSTNGGVFFERFGTAPPGLIRFIANDPLDPARIYASTSLAGLFVSTDRGSTWSVVDARLAIPSRNALTSSGSTYVAASGPDVFRSVDAGRTWQLLPRPGMTFISSVAIEPQTAALWIGSSSGIFVSAPGAPRRRAVRH